MTALVRAAIGATIVLVLPGVLIASLLRMQLRLLTTWAAIPVFSLAGVFVLGEFTNLVGVPFGVPSFAVFVTTLALGASARGLFLPAKSAAKHGEDSAVRSDGSTLEGLVAYGLLVAGIAMGLLTWARGLRGVALGPASNDGAHHGYFVARIVNTDAFDLSKVLVAEPLGQLRIYDYYPLGTHASANIATRLVGADIGRMLIVFTVLFAAVVFPLGMFVLARMLAPHHPLVAGFSALLVPALFIFPYQPSTWGAVPLIVGMAMVPVAVVLITQALVDLHVPVRDFARFVVGLAPAVLVLLATFSVHSSQLLIVVFLVILLVLERTWHKRDMTVLLNAVVRGALALLLMALLFAPTLVDVGGGVSERASSSPAGTMKVSEALGQILTHHGWGIPARQGTLAALALVGACVWLLTSRRLAWLIGWLTIVGVTLLASTSTGAISQTLTLPWYHLAPRVNYNQAFFVAFFAAVPFAFAVAETVRLLRSRRWLVPTAAVATAVLMVAVGFHSHRNAIAMLHGSYSDKGVTPASIKAYAWLARHADANDVVVQDLETDGSLWMYPYARLNPLVGLPISRAARSEVSDQLLSDQRQRGFLRRHIASVRGDPSVDALARTFRARWIYLDERTYPARKHVLDLDAIRRNPNLVEVFRHRTVHVFKIRFDFPLVDRTPPMASLSLSREAEVGSPISGKTVLVTKASDDLRVGKVEVRATGGAFSDTPIGTARITLFGWLYQWDTASVPNGTYILTSVAFDLAGNPGTSAGMSVTVQN
jgi:hypothetical protein